MKIYIVRHGETDWNRKGIIQGSTDIELNETGIDQAKETKHLLAKVKFDHIYCSPLMRAKQTANIINEEHQVEIIYDDRLRERGFGKYEGVSVKELDFSSFWDMGNNETPYQEESTIDFFNRVHNLLDHILMLDYENVLIVAHGGVSLPVYSYFNHLEKRKDYLKYMLKNCEVACYDTKVKNNAYSQ